MKIVQKISVLASALVLAASVQVCQAADASQYKIAVVNVQQVLQQSPRVAELSKKLEGQFKTRQSKINDDQKSLQDELDEFKKEAPTMSQKDRDSKQKKIAADRADLVKEVVSYQQDLQKEQTRIMQGILGDLSGIVASMAKSSNYSLVLDSQAVIYSVDGKDITADVAKQFNNKN